MSKPTPSAIVTAAAQARAATLCAHCFEAFQRLNATPTQRARAQHYQEDEFARVSDKNQRLVIEALEAGGAYPESRAEFLAAVDVYLAAGLAEVRRLFAEHRVAA